MIPGTRESKPDPLWAKPCLAYNVHLALSEQCRAALGAASGRIAASFPEVLSCPSASLHISVASFLSVRASYEIEKGLLWHRHHARWTSGLAAVVARQSRFEVRFTGVSVSDTAVFALASGQIPEIETIRSAVDALLSEAGLAGGQPDIVHSTLLRFGEAPVDLTRLAALANEIVLDVTTAVVDIVISKELVYPSLVTEEIARLALATS